MTRVLEDMDADIVAFQEMETFDGNHYSTRNVQQGFFFFSETPDKIYSTQWNGGYPYFCSWVRFRSRSTSKDFYVFNVHNDFQSRGNRLKTSELITERIENTVQEDLPLIVFGDFNAPKGFKEIRSLEAIGLSVVPPGGTTNRVQGMHLLPAIDHSLISKDFRLQSGIKVWRDRYDGVYPADHYPISVRLLFGHAATGGVGDRRSTTADLHRER